MLKCFCIYTICVLKGMEKVVRRLFVEKKKGFDIEAQGLLSDLKYSLGIDENAEIRLFNRYDIEGLSDEDFERAKVTVFSEPNVDNTFTDFLPLTEEWQHFATEYLPGQYDQRADSAAQCVQLQNYPMKHLQLSVFQHG